jgi:hypothetical protein
MDAVDVVASLARFFNPSWRDWSAMRALYHPDALLQTVTGGPDPLSADDLIAELERAASGTWYSVTSQEPVVLDKHAVLMIGRMRRSVPGGGLEDAGHVWLLTVRDGLIYRQGLFGSREEAADAYLRCGVSLGMGAESATEAAGAERLQPSPRASMQAAPREAR